MRFVHHSDSSRRALLGYCLNLHPAHTLEEFLARTAAVAVPLRERLGCKGRFGVGPWMGATLVAELLANPIAFARLVAFFRDAQLEPYTWNAFPYGEFNISKSSLASLLSTHPVDLFFGTRGITVDEFEPLLVQRMLAEDHLGTFAHHVHRELRLQRNRTWLNRGVVQRTA